MDQLSDILSSFFVNPNNKKKSSREKKRLKSEIATQTEIRGTSKSSVEDVDRHTVKEATVKEEVVKEEVVKEETVKEETVKERTVKEGTVKEGTVKEGTVKEGTVKEATVKEGTVKEGTVKEATVKEETVKEVTVKEATVKEGIVKEGTVKRGTVKRGTVKRGTVKEATVNEGTVKEGTVKEEYSDLSSDNLELKKYILKPSDFYKKNIMIINKDFENSILILGEILYKLSIMKNINKIFSSNVYITSTDEHKSIYKQILLNNPYLYFTDLHVKNKLDTDKLKEDKLRKIYVIDNELLCTIDSKEFESLLNNDVLLIIMTKDDDKNAITTYDLLTSNKILIHKLYGSKMIQKNFYKIFIKYVCKEQVSTFENYYKMINNENLDIKYLILKNDELRYN
jgi:hypothetical protein